MLGIVAYPWYKKIKAYVRTRQVRTFRLLQMYQILHMNYVTQPIATGMKHVIEKLFGYERFQ